MNLFELFVKIGVDDQASSKLKDIGGKLGNGLKTAAKIGTAAVGAAAAGITALTTAAVNSFAEYEQLAGGAQKIFDQMDYSKIATDANNAYKELGLSANQYLSVINDVGATFAATMGDEAGYEAAKTGLKAISDYASGTGKNVDELSQKFTLITRSTSSYQSIADQFSGILPATSAGFLEQAQAAGILSDKYTQLTEVPIDEYQAAVSQMLQQGVSDLGLANNTANEAFSTISGSLAMTRGAWENLVGGLANPDADLGVLIENMVVAAESAFNNLLPAAEQGLVGIATLIGNLAPVIGEKIPVVLEQVLPILLSSATNLVGVLADSIPGLIESIAPAILEAAPQLLDAVVGLLSAVVGLIGEGGLTETIMVAAFGIIGQLVSAFGELAPNIIPAALNLVQQLASGLSSQIPVLLPAILSVISGIVGMLTDQTTVEQLFASANIILTALAEAIIDCLPIILEVVTQLMESFTLHLSNPTIIAGLVQTAVALVGAIVVGLINSIPVLLKAAVRLISQFIAQFTRADWGSIGKNIVDGMKAGISKAWTSMTRWFKNLFGDLIGIAKKILGIASPSKIFKKLGSFTAEGFGIGFEDEFAHVKNDMEDALNFDDTSVGINASIRKMGAGAAGGAFGGTSFGDIIINVNGDKHHDEKALAEAMAIELQRLTDRSAAVYA